MIMNEIKIFNLKQATLYIKNGVLPIRLETSKGNNSDILIFVFNKKDTKDVWKKWSMYILE